MVHSLGVIALIAYLGACLFGVLGIVRASTRRGDFGVQPSRAFRVAEVLQLVGVIGLALLVLVLCFSPSTHPVEYLLWAALAFEVLMRVVRLGFPMVRLLGAALVSVILLSSSTLLHVEIGGVNPGVFAVLTHVLPAVVGLASLFGALVVSLLFMLQYRALKGKRLPDLTHKTPGLALLDHAHAILSAVGGGSLTLALLIGAFVLPQGRLLQFWWRDTSIVSSLLAWMVLLALIQLRFLEWPMRRRAQVTIFGVAVLLLVVGGVIALSGSLVPEHMVKNVF